jgi:hypothetical protein
MESLGWQRFWLMMLLVTFGVSGWAALEWVGGSEATPNEQEPVAVVCLANSPEGTHRATARQRLGTSPNQLINPADHKVPSPLTLSVSPPKAGKSCLQFISLRRE